MKKQLIDALIRHLGRAGLLLAPILCIFITGSLQAQETPGGAPTAPLPGNPPSVQTWQAYLVMGLLFAVVMAVSVKPGKRTHQD